MKAYLALHYPDQGLGRGIVVATTRDHDVIHRFKEAVLEEAKTRCGLAEDEIVMLMERLESERLERLLTVLVPEIGWEPGSMIGDNDFE